MDKKKARSSFKSNRRHKEKVHYEAREMEVQNIESIPSGSLGIDIALGVGYISAEVIEIFGPESSGHTLHFTIVTSSKKGGTCAFIDAEYNLMF